MRAKYTVGEVRPRKLANIACAAGLSWVALTGCTESSEQPVIAATESAAPASQEPTPCGGDKSAPGVGIHLGLSDVTELVGAAGPEREQRGWQEIDAIVTQYLNEKGSNETSATVAVDVGRPNDDKFEATEALADTLTETAANRLGIMAVDGESYLAQDGSGTLHVWLEQPDPTGNTCQMA